MAQPRKLIFKSRVKQSLAKALEDAKVDPGYLAGPFQIGYCASNVKMMQTVKEWHQKTFPQFKLAESSQDYRWAQNIFQSFNIIVVKPSIAQTFLNSRAVNFLSANPIPNNDFAIRKYTKGGGHCDGYAFFAARFLATELQVQLQTISDEEQCVTNAWQKCEGVLDGLRNYVRDEQPKSCKLEDIVNMVREVSGVQHARYVLGEAGGDWHKISAKFPGVRFQKIDATFDSFTEENVLATIKNFLAYQPDWQSNIIECESKSQESKPHESSSQKITLEVLRFGANKHATTIIKIVFKNKPEPLIIYFDSNSNRLLLPNKTQNPVLLTRLVSIAHKRESNSTSFRVQHFIAQQIGWDIACTPHLLNKQMPEVKDIASKIICSIRLGNIDLFKTYITELKDINTPIAGSTVLILSAQWCRDEFIELLLNGQYAVNLEAKKAISHRRAIHFLVLFGNAKSLEILLKRGAEVDPETKPGTKPGMTPLALAVKIGRLKCAKVLIDHGADLFAVDSQGSSILDLAKMPEMRSLIQNAITERRQKSREQHVAKRKSKREQKSRDALLFQSLFGGSYHQQKPSEHKLTVSAPGPKLQSSPKSIWVR